MSVVKEPRVAFALYLTLEVTLCSALTEVKRLCCTWPAVSKDEHGAEQKQQEIEVGEAQPCIHVLDGLYYLSLHLDLPRDGTRLLREGQRPAKGIGMLSAGGKSL